MNSREKRMALIFAMFFIAAFLVTLLFGTGDATGEAVKEFNSISEKSDYCENLCDEEMSKQDPVYSNWTECHEECMKG